MPEMQCHSCQKKFRLPASATPGKKFKCPGCKTVLTVPEPEEEPVDLAAVQVDEPEVVEDIQAEPPPPLPDEAPAGRDKESEADAWPLVARGANLHVIANGAYLAALLLFLIAFFVGTSEPPAPSARGGPPVASGGGTFSQILEYLVEIAWLGGLLVAMIAVGLWMAVPMKHGSRGFAVTLLALTFLVVLRFSNVGAGGGGFSPVPLYLFEGARLTVLALFMQSIGRNVKQSSLTETAGLLSMVTPAALGGVLLICFALTKVMDPSATMIKILAILFVLGLGGMAGWSLMLLMNMATVVRRKAKR